MKKVVMIILVFQIFHAQGMDDFPNEIRKMCENKHTNASDDRTRAYWRGSGIEHHCDELKKLFYCVRAHNSSNPPTQGDRAYCSHVDSFDKKSRLGLPENWHSSYHVKELAEESGVNDPRIVAALTQSTLDALRKKSKNN